MLTFNNKIIICPYFFVFYSLTFFPNFLKNKTHSFAFYANIIFKKLKIFIHNPSGIYKFIDCNCYDIPF